MGNKKYYWLKLKKDFFKRHDIRIIEEMPNGKDYILFYLKLLVESIDHEGCLRFSETVPYNEQMLSVITHTNIDIVRSAMKVFLDLKMIEVYTDETIFMSEVTALIGCESASAKRMRKMRSEKNKGITSQCDNNVTLMLQKSDTEIDKDKEIESDIELDKDKEFICLIDKQINSIVASMNEKQKTVYRDFFEIEPFIEMPIKNGSIQISEEMLVVWGEKYPDVCVAHELQEIRTWLKANGSKMTTTRTLDFIERWLSKHQKEDTLTEQELSVLHKSKEKQREEYERSKNRRDWFFENMNDEKWLNEFLK